MVTYAVITRGEATGLRNQLRRRLLEIKLVWFGRSLRRPVAPSVYTLAPTIALCK
jgi:hypothetical protein